MNELDLAYPFVPMLLLALVRQDGRTVTVPGAILLADLTNFTGLTEALSAQAGTDGGELVNRDLNEALCPAIDAIMAHGGEVIKFSGDGLLCMFPGGGVAADRALDASREIAVASVRGPAGEMHRFRSAIVHGAIDLTRIGGYRGRYELVAAGEAVERAQELVARAEPGKPGYLERLATTATEAAPHDLPPSDPSSYLPPYVRDRLTEALAPWLHEFRTLTILFAATEFAADSGSLQDASRAIQAIADGRSGQLLRFSVEGKCLVAEVAFGLVVGVAATGPREALQCAAQLASEVAGTRVGVSTGRVLLGPIGSASRRQLTSLGTAVNLAARLMQHAASGEALSDQRTWAAAKGSFRGTPGQASLKGLGERTFWRVDVAEFPSPAEDEGFFGRFGEMHAVREVLASQFHPARPIVIVGEAGIGKSRFSQWLARELSERGFLLWTATATPVGRDNPYSGLAAVIAKLCGLRPGVDSLHQLRTTAQRTLGDAERSPLFSDALRLSLPDTATTSALSGGVRADNIREALTSLFAEQAGRTATALIVDDAHWLDSTSWALLQRLASDVGSLQLVIVTRPMFNLEPEPLQAIRARQALVLSLEPLGAQDIVSLMSRRMSSWDVPTNVAQWVVDRARGNPFFAQELVAMLFAFGRIEIRDGVFFRTPTAAELEELPLATTIERTIEQRIDRLEVEDAVAIKIASVIGSTFSLDSLGDLTPRSTGTEIATAADRLVAADMIMPADEQGRFAFRHRYTQEAAYRMLPRAMRRELHRRVAAGIENRLAARAVERAGELAYHWFAGEDWANAVIWLERAGMQALRSGADREAVTHFRRAISVDLEQPRGRLAAWHRQLARALLGLGQVEDVAIEARKALKLVAGPLPTSALGWAGVAAVTALARLLIPRSWRLSRTKVGQGADLLEGAHAAGLLAESAYFVNAPEMMLGSALLAVSLAERTPSAAPVSVAYGMLGVVAGMARLHGTARRYLGRARALSEAASDPFQLGVAWFYTGMYFGCIGDWDASLDAEQRALSLTEPLGAHAQSGFQLTLMATNALYTSEYAKTRAWMATVASRAERSANVQQQGWSFNVLSVADLHQARYSQAAAGAERARQIFLRERDRISLIIAEGVQCAALCRADRMQEALQGADRASAVIDGARPTTWGQLEGFAGPCEVYAVALQRGLMSRTAARHRIRKAMFGLRLFAWVFPLGRARYHWICALYASASGNRGAARRRLRRAILFAQRFRMPFEEMRATELLEPLVDGEERVRMHLRLQALRATVLRETSVDQAAVHFV